MHIGNEPFAIDENQDQLQLTSLSIDPKANEISKKYKRELKLNADMLKGGKECFFNSKTIVNFKDCMFT